MSMSNALSTLETLQKKFNNSSMNEANTRFQIIDKIIKNVFNWPDNFIELETKTHEGYTDYQLKDSKIVSLTAMGEAINELKSGQVEGVVLEKAIAQGYVDQNSDLAVSDIALKSDSKDAYAVAMPKGSDKLKAKVNKVIAKLKKEGKIDSYVQDAYTLSLKSSSK